jgi:hypothetical protein
VISASCMELKQKTWAIIKQQWCFDHGGMQYNVYAFGGHAIFSAKALVDGRDPAEPPSHLVIFTVMLGKSSEGSSEITRVRDCCIASNS